MFLLCKIWRLKTETLADWGAGIFIHHVFYPKTLAPSCSWYMPTSFGAFVRVLFCKHSAHGRRRGIGAADVNQSRKSGTTPLHIASCHGHVEAAQVLVSAQARPLIWLGGWRARWAWKFVNFSICDIIFPRRWCHNSINNNKMSDIVTLAHSHQFVKCQFPGGG